MAREVQGRPSGEKERAGHRVRLPGFVEDDEVGLGDIAQQVSHAMSITPCRGCQERARRLNRWLAFSGRRSGGR